MNLRKLLERLYVLPVKIQQAIGLFLFVVCFGVVTLALFWLGF
jgi:hypothetical protein